MIAVGFARWDAIDPEGWRAAQAGLSSEERARARDWGDSLDAAAWLGGRMVLRAVAARVLGRAAWSLAWEPRPSGGLAVPGRPDVGISLARSTGIAVAAVRVEGVVGVDVEACARFPGDAAGAWDWCVREAVAKASGCGLDGALGIAVGPEGAVVDPSGVEWRVVPIGVPAAWRASLCVPLDCAETVSVEAVRFGTIAP